MSMTEKWWNEGWVDGKEEGLAEGVSTGASKMLELIKNGLSPDEAFRKVNDESTKLISTLAHNPA
jgi:hypothetical protein